MSFQLTGATLSWSMLWRSRVHNAMVIPQLTRLKTGSGIYSTTTSYFDPDHCCDRRVVLSRCAYALFQVDIDNRSHEFSIDRSHIVVVDVGDIFYNHIIFRSRSLLRPKGSPSCIILCIIRMLLMFYLDVLTRFSKSTLTIEVMSFQLTGATLSWSMLKEWKKGKQAKESKKYCI
jgi:hypothetical protein